MTAPRRVADLTEDELRELVAAAVDEGVRRSRTPRSQPAERRRPTPTARDLEDVSKLLRRKGILGRRR